MIKTKLTPIVDLLMAITVLLVLATVIFEEYIAILTHAVTLSSIALALACAGEVILAIKGEVITGHKHRRKMNKQYSFSGNWCDGIDIDCNHTSRKRVNY